MFTYLITAFSFLAANFGWFGGMPQTEIFFWTEVIISVAIVLAIGIFLIAVFAGSGTSLLGAGISILYWFFAALIFLICILVAWIATMLWSVDFFLAYQLMCIGSATAGLFKVNVSNEK